MTIASLSRAGIIVGTAPLYALAWCAGVLMRALAVCVAVIVEGYRTGRDR